jgi:ParB/RepB/Spo0J family partition protein
VRTTIKTRGVKKPARGRQPRQKAPPRPYAARRGQIVTSERVRLIPRQLLHRDPTQPRQEFDAKELADLRASIDAKGIEQPLIVWPHPTKKGAFMLHSGERRTRATKGLRRFDRLPCIVRAYPGDARERLVAQLVTNTGKPLTPLEEARAYRRLTEGPRGLSQSEVARRLGVPRASVGDRVRLLDLHPQWLDDLERGRLALSQAIALIPYAKRAPEVQRVVRTWIRERVGAGPFAEVPIAEWRALVEGAFHWADPKVQPKRTITVPKAAARPALDETPITISLPSGGLAEGWFWKDGKAYGPQTQCPRAHHGCTGMVRNARLRQRGPLNVVDADTLQPHEHKWAEREAAVPVDSDITGAALATVRRLQAIQDAVAPADDQDSTLTAEGGITPPEGEDGDVAGGSPPDRFDPLDPIELVEQLATAPDDAARRVARDALVAAIRRLQRLAGHEPPAVFAAHASTFIEGTTE